MTETPVTCATEPDAPSWQPHTAPPAARAWAESLAAQGHVKDWALLLHAVQTRLERAISGSGGVAPWQGREMDCPGGIRSTVMECAAALGQLESLFAQDAAHYQRVELELFDTRTALAQARAELIGTQAGEKQARHRALHDSLTALPNRDCFMEQLDQALAAPQSAVLAVMFLDLDGFKPVNDAHGHAVGDELLRIVAVRLGRVVRADDMVGRLGGDEFACLLRGFSGRQQLHHLAGKIYDSVSAPCKVGPHTLAVRPSIGIARSPHDGDDAHALLNNADAAMYHAKRQRTGHAFFSA